jgi:two-component system, LytTR family, response regulator
MNLTCYLIDDEKPALDILQGFIQRTPGVTLGGLASNPLAGLEEITNQGQIDAAFIDIDMPELDGLQLAHLLPARTQVIFTTAFRQYGPEAFSINAADYLLKPVSYERFLLCIQKLKNGADLSKLTTKEPQAFYIKSGNKGKLYRILTEEVVYVEAALNYLHFFTGQERITTYMSLTEVAGQLPAQNFFRVHKSFIVNTKMIQSLEQNHIRMKNQAVVPVGRAFRQAFMSYIEAQLLRGV